MSDAQCVDEEAFASDSIIIYMEIHHSLLSIYEARGQSFEVATVFRASRFLTPELGPCWKHSRLEIYVQDISDLARIRFNISINHGHT